MDYLFYIFKINNLQNKKAVENFCITVLFTGINKGVFALFRFIVFYTQQYKGGLGAVIHNI